MFHLLIHQPKQDLSQDFEMEALFADEDLRQALKYLRGFVDWHLTLLGPNQELVAFDVMKNRRVPSPAHIPPKVGLLHELTFYQYVP
jgi:hypothetical protein